MSSAPDPIATLTENAAYLVSQTTHAQVAKDSGGFLTTRTVGHIAEGKHRPTFRSLLGLAHGVRIAVWQLFVMGMPRDQQQRRNLAFVVRAFIELDERARTRLVSDAEILCTAEGKLAAVQKAVAREEFSLGIVRRAADEG